MKTQRANPFYFWNPCRINLCAIVSLPLRRSITTTVGFCLFCFTLISLSQAVKAQDYLILTDSSVRKVKLLDPRFPGQILIKEENGTRQIDNKLVQLTIRENAFPTRKAKVTVMLSASEEVRGVIVYADSSGLMVWKGEEKYVPGKPQFLSPMLPYGSIQIIRLDKKGTSGKSAASGFLGGASIGFILGFATNEDNILFSPLESGLLIGAFFGAVGGSVGGIIDLTSSFHSRVDIQHDRNIYQKMLPILRRHALLKSPPLEWRGNDQGVTQVPKVENQTTQITDSSIIDLSNENTPAIVTDPKINPLLRTNEELSAKVVVGKKVNIKFKKPQITASGTIISKSDTSLVIRINQPPYKQMVPFENISKMEVRTPREISYVHISWNHGFTIGGPASSMKKAIEASGYGGVVDNWFFSGSTTYPLKRKGGRTMSLGIDVDILPAWRAGIHHSKIFPVEIQGLYGVSETAYRNSWEFTMTWVKHPYRENFTTHSEWSLGMGVSINHLNVNTNIEDFYILDYNGTPRIAQYQNSFKKTKPGLVLRVAYDSYIMKNLSLHFRLEPRIIPSLKVSQLEGHKSLTTHRVNFSSVEPSMGLRLHF